MLFLLNPFISLGHHSKRNMRKIGPEPNEFEYKLFQKAFWNFTDNVLKR